uniref:DUF3504 domain-containing protein n=1 Tax=Malurus cyaneus samueli TaxID=2593467 RepID=A0A8C5T9G6_9PASS
MRGTGRRPRRRPPPAPLLQRRREEEGEEEDEIQEVQITGTRRENAMGGAAGRGGGGRGDGSGVGRRGGDGAAAARPGPYAGRRQQRRRGCLGGHRGGCPGGGGGRPRGAAEDGGAGGGPLLQRPERARLSENTRLATRYAVRIFREYLSEKAQSPDFETMDKGALCRVLRSFYAEARSKSGQLYSKSSLISIRSSLNRYLNEPPYCRTLDLTKDPELRAANLTLAAVIRKLEEQGAGPVVQKQAITRADLRKLYTCSTCMYFCTRGRENQRELEEDSFGLAVDEDGRKFVYFKALGPYHKSRSSSWSKKRAESSDEENLPRMYETGTEFCPYASFVKYLSKRNPLCKAFFQRPRDHCSEGDITWYENKAIGKNLLGTRMQMLSKAAKLSKTYTNHCIGAVSIATLNSIAGIGTKLEDCSHPTTTTPSPPPPPPHHPAAGAATPLLPSMVGLGRRSGRGGPGQAGLYEAVFPAGAAAGGDACGPSASPKRLCRRPAEPLDAAAPAVVVVSVKHDPLPHLLPEANGHRSTTSPTVVSPAIVSPTQLSNLFAPPNSSRPTSGLVATTVCRGVKLKWCLGAATLPLNGITDSSALWAPPFPPFDFFPPLLFFFWRDVTYESRTRRVDRGIRYH